MTGREKCRKRCTSNRYCSLERIFKENHFKNLGKIDEDWTESVHQEPPYAEKSATAAAFLISGHSAQVSALPWSNKFY